jgi:hypothetical protein
MTTQVNDKVNNLMNTAKIFTNTYSNQITLANYIALQCLNEAYKSSSLESSRIEFWEDVMDEFKEMQKEVE